ncbi:MAG: Re/Si-specific NAD(P)(+) transhydrogenase subunit alpha [Candidatus Binatia bacterium]|nr:Re/Si-specific NAD(P)(+) transhydrogenase subunit alpha [Candidatus Binatia bacterium]
MVVGVPRESFPGEQRVALIPASVPALTKAGFTVVLERGAGEQAGFPDAAYEEKGAEILPDRAAVFARANIIVQVLGIGANPPRGAEDLTLFRPGQVVVGFLRPLGAPEAIEQLARTGVSAFAVELMPRITRAQSMDALTSMATIAGYKAVVVAAHALPKLFPLMMTAAGTLRPAKVLILGAGVAGLQAIATARKLGGVVSAYDIRPAAKEQVLSLGARFVELPLEVQDVEDKSGYAKAQDERFYERQRELLARVVADSDVVITTANVPGRKAPVLVTDEMVAGMAPGSVIVDLAAERGGNCSVTQAGKEISYKGVSVFGPINIAGTVPYHASQMYSNNLVAFLLHVFPKGEMRLNLEDEITAGTLVAHEGRVVHPAVQRALAQPH